mmetsp:Transcript_46115/g.108221  ORF Transcript_46115/g.108221 Transcript_46115/m.108221 type:complete len:237 (+) Transcript_46115:250-960(+)
MCSNSFLSLSMSERACRASAAACSARSLATAASSLSSRSFFIACSTTASAAASASFASSSAALDCWWLAVAACTTLSASLRVCSMLRTCSTCCIRRRRLILSTLTEFWISSAFSTCRSTSRSVGNPSSPADAPRGERSTATDAARLSSRPGVEPIAGDISWRRFRARKLVGLDGAWEGGVSETTSERALAAGVSGIPPAGRKTIGRLAMICSISLSTFIPAANSVFWHFDAHSSRP